MECTENSNTTKSGIWSLILLKHGTESFDSQRRLFLFLNFILFYFILRISPKPNLYWRLLLLYCSQLHHRQHLVFRLSPSLSRCCRHRFQQLLLLHCCRLSHSLYYSSHSRKVLHVMYFYFLCFRLIHNYFIVRIMSIVKMVSVY